MKKLGMFSILLFFIGIAFLIIGFLSGEIEAGLFLIFPIFIGSGPFAFIGFVCIFLSIISTFLFFPNRINNVNYTDLEINDTIKEGKNSIKAGGIAFIGPIPIVLASNWKIAIFLLIISAIFLLMIFLIRI